MAVLPVVFRRRGGGDFGVVGHGVDPVRLRCWIGDEAADLGGVRSTMLAPGAMDMHRINGVECGSGRCDGLSTVLLNRLHGPFRPHHGGRGHAGRRSDWPG